MEEIPRKQEKKKRKPEMDTEGNGWKRERDEKRERRKQKWGWGCWRGVRFTSQMNCSMSHPLSSIPRTHAHTIQFPLT